MPSVPLNCDQISPRAIRSQIFRANAVEYLTAREPSLRRRTGRDLARASATFDDLEGIGNSFGCEQMAGALGRRR
ncbi:hypothetical protein [Phenylobacterium sp.]|uniref:hypothetical protein n=1 Tax=Phenylobacterium sp. TaxID=1871053 RepID=UPI003564EDE0